MWNLTDFSGGSNQLNPVPNYMVVHSNLQAKHQVVVSKICGFFLPPIGARSKTSVEKAFSQTLVRHEWFHAATPDRLGEGIGHHRRHTFQKIWRRLALQFANGKCFCHLWRIGPVLTATFLKEKNYSPAKWTGPFSMGYLIYLWVFSFVHHVCPN